MSKFLVYKDQYVSQVKKDIKKLDKQVAVKALTVCIPAILENPLSGGLLSGDLAGVRSYHFNYNSVQYRIAYIVKEQIVTILFLAIAKRENFYDLLKNRF